MLYKETAIAARYGKSTALPGVWLLPLQSESLRIVLPGYGRFKKAVSVNPHHFPSNANSL